MSADEGQRGPRSGEPAGSVWWLPTAAGAAGLAATALTASTELAWVGFGGVLALGAYAWRSSPRIAPAAAASGTLAPAPPSAPATNPDGPYELERRLGAGSMGEVWRARHRRLGRTAAVKTIKALQASAEDVERFKREARAIAELCSPHTVKVYDFGVRSDGAFYYAMELLEGIDLQSLVSRHGAVPPERAVAALLQACHSLAEAHDHGLVHRDIKPANLMLCTYGRDYDFLKVLDFGLVKGVRKGESAVDNPNLTLEHTVLGTAAYLAPESLAGSKQVDGRVDVYALGCVLFWLVSGRLVFERPRVMEMVKAHAAEPPPSLASVAPGPLPPGLAELVADCLEKRPDRRVPSIDALTERLRAVSLPAPWTSRRAEAWWREHRAST